ncbi:MAG: hypothetical protein J6M93_01030 [Succinivibrio sp.]|nr:hypothetical protein [Succinivibrio sp.]
MYSNLLKGLLSVFFVLFALSSEAVILCNTDKLNRTVCHDENGQAVSGANRPWRVITRGNTESGRNVQTQNMDKKTGPVITTRDRIKVERGQVKVCRQDNRNLKEEHCVVQAQPDAKNNDTDRKQSDIEEKN